MLRPLHSERNRLLVILGIYLLVSSLSGYWAITAIILLVFYALILFYDNYLIVRWLRKGADMTHYPNVFGLSEEVVSNIYQLRKRGKQRNKRLRAILDRFYSMSVGLPDAVIVLKLDNSIEWSNERAIELLGISHERDRGQRIDNLIRAPEFHHYLSNGDFDQPLRIFAPVGNDMVLNIRMVRFKDGAQLLLARDLTTIVRAEDMRRSFVSNVSHEMRTPLTVINGYTETLLGDEDMPEEYRIPMNAIANQSHRLQNIIDGLLELSRLQDRPLNQSEDYVPVASLVREILSEIASSQHAGKNTINSELDDALQLKGSPVLMQSVISNLVYNAIHHAGEGAAIDIYWGDSGEEAVELVVTDNGQGIESQHLSRITERFYRVDSSRVRQKGDEFGAGLGMAIVKHIVEAHDGELILSSRVDVGTTFRCVFKAEQSLSVESECDKKYDKPT